MFEEDVTISKQTFRLVLYPLRRPMGLQFCNMVIVHTLGSLQVLHQQVFPDILSYKKTTFFQEYVIISPRWVGGKLSTT